MMMKQKITRKVNITQGNFHFRKPWVAEKVYTALEITLTKKPALYRYTETVVYSLVRQPAGEDPDVLT